MDLVAEVVAVGVFRVVVPADSEGHTRLLASTVQTPLTEDRSVCGELMLDERGCWAGGRSDRADVVVTVGKSTR